MALLDMQGMTSVRDRDDNTAERSSLLSVQHCNSLMSTANCN